MSRVLVSVDTEEGISRSLLHISMRSPICIPDHEYCNPYIHILCRSPWKFIAELGGYCEGSGSFEGLRAGGQISGTWRLRKYRWSAYLGDDDRQRINKVGCFGVIFHRFKIC